MKTKQKQKSLELQLLLAVIAASRTQTPPSSPSPGAGFWTRLEHCGAFYDRKESAGRGGDEQPSYPPVLQQDPQ